MLKNAYLLGNIGADTAENELKFCWNFADRPLQAAPEACAAPLPAWRGGPPRRSALFQCFKLLFQHGWTFTRQSRCPTFQPFFCRATWALLADAREIRSRRAPDGRRRRRPVADRFRRPANPAKIFLSLAETLRSSEQCWICPPRFTKEGGALCIS